MGLKLNLSVYSQYHQLRFIAHQGILLLDQFKPFLHQLWIVLFTHSCKKHIGEAWETWQLTTHWHTDLTQTPTQQMRWQPSQDVFVRARVGWECGRPWWGRACRVHRGWRGGATSDWTACHINADQTGLLRHLVFFKAVDIASNFKTFFFFFFRTIFLKCES